MENEIKQLKESIENESEYYLKINKLPESCVKCFAFSTLRDGWCMAKPELYVYMYDTTIHPKCPIRCIARPTFKTQSLTLQ